MAKSSIKTAFIGGWVNGLVDLATGVPALETVESWLSQDDIRIVAIEVGTSVAVEDGDVNADGSYRVDVQLSRSGTIDAAGCLLAVAIGSTWTAAIVAGGDQAEQKTINFPQGTGVDIDSGESLNLLIRASWIGTASLRSNSFAIVHYIER